MEKIVVLGLGRPLQEVVQTAKNAIGRLEIVELPLSENDGFNFEPPDMAAYPRSEWQAFVAVDERALNLPRLQLVARLKAAGYKLARIISKDASLAETAVVGENTVVHAWSRIGERCQLGLNVVIRSDVCIAADAKIGASNYIGERATIEQGAVTGDHVTVGPHVTIAASARIGKYCELCHERTYDGEVAGSTFYVPGFENPIKIVTPY